MSKKAGQQVVCPSCGELTAEGQALCQQCQAPLSGFGAMSVQGQGHVYRQAMRHRVGLVGLIVVWLMFAAIVVIPVLKMLEHPGLRREIWVPGLAWLVCGYLVYRLTRSYLSGKPFNAYDGDADSEEESQRR